MTNQAAPTLVPGSNPGLKRPEDSGRGAGASDSARALSRASSKKRRNRRRTLTFLAMGAPALIALFVFSYLPMAGIVLAFENYLPAQGILGSQWVGFQNFLFLFASNDAWRITRNTVGMNGIFIVVNTSLSLGLAILLNEIKDRSKILFKAYQSAFFLPFVLSYVAIAAFTLAFLSPENGVVNEALRALGLHTVSWYSAPGWWPLILTVVEAWKRIGFWVIVYLAAMIAINPEFYEAADIDGATRWQKIRWITLPTLLPLVTINILLSIGGIFSADFGLFFQVTQNSTPLYPTTDVIDTYVYRSLTSLGNVGMAAAAGLYQSFVGFVLVITANWLVRRKNSDGALF